MTRTLLLTPLLVALSSLPALGQPSAVHLTVADAIARALEASHRLAEVRPAGRRGGDRPRRISSRPSVVASASTAQRGRGGRLPTPTGGIRVVFRTSPTTSSRASRRGPSAPPAVPTRFERAATAEATALGAPTSRPRAPTCGSRCNAPTGRWRRRTKRCGCSSLVERAEAAGDARARLDVGLVPPSDVLTFEAQRSRERLQLIEAINQRESALIDLRRLTGLPDEAEVTLADRLDAPGVLGAGAATSPGAAEAATLVSEALSQRPERQALEQRISAPGRGTRRIGGPEADHRAGGRHRLRQPNPRSSPPGHLADVMGGGRHGQLERVRQRPTRQTAEASALARAAGRLKDLDTLVRADVRQRMLDLRSGVAAVRAAEDGVRAAAEARRVLGERFAAGVATTTDVLVAQDQLLMAELSRARALATVRLAEARLQRALGRP